jgi:hypothetical protein
MNERFQALAKIAPKLAVLREDANARMYYELMSGALVWSDELPPVDQLESGEPNCLRGVWRYRTTLMLGEPEEKIRAGWERLLAWCPSWPGFLADRRTPDPERIKYYHERSAKSLADWEALDARFEAQQAANKVPVV